jgi:hypothetical protein
MDNHELIAAKLTEAGLTFFSDKDVDDLANLYEGMLQWQTMLEEAVKPETEPATIFRVTPGV